MTRLNRLLGTGWAIAISALFFGFLHIGTDLFRSGSPSILVVLALAIYGQMAGGVTFAVLLQRSGSLVPGIITHSLGDVIASFI